MTSSTDTSPSQRSGGISALSTSWDVLWSPSGWLARDRRHRLAEVCAARGAASQQDSLLHGPTDERTADRRDSLEETSTAIQTAMATIADAGDPARSRYPARAWERR